MPEEQKSGASTAEASAAENGTRTSSPSKSPSNKGKTVLARITLLDGTVKDFPIEVKRLKNNLHVSIILSMVN